MGGVIHAVILIHVGIVGPMDWKYRESNSGWYEDLFQSIVGVAKVGAVDHH